MLSLREERLDKLDSGLERLIRLQGSDPGFYILALHAFIESFLREVFPPPTRDEDGFSWLLQAFREFLVANAARYIQGLDVLGLIRAQHAVTNDVRHRFGTADAEEACAATQHLRRFCTLAGLDGLRNLPRLLEALKAWEERRCAAEVVKELKETGFKLLMAKREKDALVGRIKELENAEEQLRHLREQKKLVEAKLAETEEAKERKDAKVDALRAELNARKLALENEQKIHQEKLKELASARDYLNSLSRVTIYTRTRFDYDRTVTRLTKEQEKVLGQIQPGSDFLVKGSAGTGKTLVLLKAVEKVKGKEAGSLGMDLGESVALLTYTISLVKYDRYLSELISGENPADRVGTADAFFREKLELLEPGAEVDYKAAETLAAKYPVEGLTDKELAAEAESFVWGNDVSRESYTDGMIERKGMKTALRAEQRKAVWTSLEAMASEMEANRKYSKNYSRVKLIRYAEAHPEDERLRSTDFIFIDEAQDLSAADLKFLKLCARRSVVLAGDSDQSIYQPGFTYSRAGIDIQGRTRILRTNFRNTTELQRIAERYRSTMPGWDPENQPEAFRLGPPPEHYSAKERRDLLDLLLARFDVFVKHLSYDPENICIVAPLNEDLVEIKQLLEAKGYPAADVKAMDFDFSSRGVVRLSTMHSSKGLDFPVVLLFLHRLPYTGGVWDEESLDKMGRNLVYVAITRAMDHLNVFTSERTTNKAILDLVEAFGAEEENSQRGKEFEV